MTEQDGQQPLTTDQRILIVDDSDYDLEVMRTILESAGYSVTDFNSGKLGLQAIKEKTFDLVILDLRMPDVDGFEILEAIRGQIPKPLVLAVSGFVRGELLTVAKALGADAVLDKHLLTDTLLPTVRTLLDNVSSASSSAGCSAG